MATLTATAGAVVRRPGRGLLAGAAIVGWLLLFVTYRGHDTLFLDTADVTPLHLRLNDVDTWIGAHRDSSPVFLYFFNVIRLVVDALVTFIQALISQGVPIPQVGWLGVVAIAGYITWLAGNLRVAVLTMAGFTVLGLQGLWQQSMDTLAMTIASVLVALLVGIPLGVWAGLSARFNGLLTPVLDFMQTMPTFVYLAPLTLFFLIGPASAAIATLIYAMPPVIRITAHGIRSVPTDSVEASRSLGATPLQSLRKVLLPMARRTIILGINQTIMAALSMVVIAALIDSPGLGQVVYQALIKTDVGTAFNGGLALVVMAIVLDRSASAAGTRVDRPVAEEHPGWMHRVHRPLVAGVGLLVLFGVYLSRTYVWAAEFPSSVTFGSRSIGLDIGARIAEAANSATHWVQVHFGGVTAGLKNVVSAWVINPFQEVLTQTPWYGTFAMVVIVTAVVGGWRAAATAGVCLALIIGTGLWSDALTTLASVLLATVLVIALGVVLGVWMGRSPRADRLIRPTLDALQVMPSFVYLVPFMALFAPTRFTAILAAVLYAAPVSIKIIADGISGVPEETVEAATAAGSGAWQIITKVQLPMARSALALAANQGLIYVLAMVVVGGLVGGGALGYDVVAGFAQISLFGKGLAAGLAIVLLGIMLDRISQAAVRRRGGGTVLTTG